MERAVRARGLADGRIMSDRYFELVDEGILEPDDRVELLEGVVVAMSPQSPRHAGVVSCAYRALTRAVGERAAIRVQLPLVLGQHSVPDPDVAIVLGHESDYLRAHPTRALLVVEVADSSLQQDRLTKLGIYAAAGVPEVWIVNLRKNCVEIFRRPSRGSRRYRSTNTAARGDTLTPVSFSDVRIAVEKLLPSGR